ncbi:CARNMT1 [Mytilus edulis]|uniref:Carnosine N-methyltransferase n=1 Tax=Mytilus edulis TaxID=6550 RepID=A0A8S3PNI7_MYTED|nr:CARNMT1 [Mytilus edulis]
MDNPNTQLFYRLINRGRSNSRTTTNCLKIDGEYIFCHEDQRKRFAQYYEDLSVPKEEIYDNSYLNLCKIRQNYVQEALEESGITGKHGRRKFERRGAVRKRALLRIINAFKYYRIHSSKRVKMQWNLSRNCVDHNYEIIQLVIKDAEYMFENKTHEPTEDEKEVPPTQFDMDKVRTTIKQFVRDWSADGHSEREACYLPIVMEICEKFPNDPSKISVLVPGAGLGRLAYEIAKQGYSCQGNEWSLFMLMASNFILNKCNAVKSFTLYPWIHQWTNNTYTEDQTASCKFPDVNPAELPPNSNFSMAAGDFLEIYTDPDTFDCVATVFFIDTAHCIISYIETIYNILKPGGYWINLGPLLYHYSDIPNEVSIELSYEELKKVIKQVGFVIQREEKDVRSTYTQNPKSMLRYEYSSVFFTAQKPVS